MKGSYSTVGPHETVGRIVNCSRLSTSLGLPSDSTRSSFLGGYAAASSRIGHVCTSDRLRVAWLNGPPWEGFCESRRCSKDTYPDSYITECDLHTKRNRSSHSLRFHCRLQSVRTTPCTFRGTSRISKNHSPRITIGP